MCHISELAAGRVEEVEDVCKEGDTLEFVVVNVDQSGKIRLSRRIAMMPEEEVADAIEAAQSQASRGGGSRGGGRGGDRGGRERGRGRERSRS